jgi:uncharacterized protein YraI
VKRLMMAGTALLLAATSASAATGDRCKVTDPTGTPLNVRSGPNGKIIGTLKNGTLVSITEYKDDANGKQWVDVADYNTKKAIGWVFREFVSCY